MPVEDWALLACVVIAGLWSGLLAMLTTILHPMLRGLDGAGFTRFLDAFLPLARKSVFNYAMVLGLRRDPLLGPGEPAGGLGADQAALLHAELDPRRLYVGRAGALRGGAGRAPLGQQCDAPSGKRSRTSPVGRRSTSG